MGEPLPLPGIFTFHSGAAGSMSGIFPSTIPEPLGPRNRGQSPAELSVSVSASVREDRKQRRVIGGVLAGGKGWARAGGIRGLSQTPSAMQRGGRGVHFLLPNSASS